MYQLIAYTAPGYLESPMLQHPFMPCRNVDKILRLSLNGFLLSVPTKTDTHFSSQAWNFTALNTLLAITVGLLALGLIGVIWLRQRSEKHFKKVLHTRQSHLQMVLWGSGNTFWELDLQARTLHHLSAKPQLGGQHDESLSYDDWREHTVHPNDLASMDGAMIKHLAGHSDFFESKYRLRSVDGGWTWVLSRGKVIDHDVHGQALWVIGTTHDLNLDLAFQRQQTITNQIVLSMSEAVVVTDAKMQFISVNPAFYHITGYCKEDVLGHTTDLLNSSNHPPEYYGRIRQSLEHSGHWQGELWQQHKSGEAFLGALEIQRVGVGLGTENYYVAVLTDITERKRTEQELRYLANFDSLTGLPNRSLLMDRLSDGILRARQLNRRLGVLFVDLDRFKHVNDALGHSAGDRVLIASGTRLRANIRDDDQVARLGGDEFAIVLERVAESSDAVEVAKKLIQAFSEPLLLGDGQEISITPSIGIALFPDHADVPSELLKYADMAMYKAKEKGRNTVSVYTRAMDAEVRQRADMIAGLQRAMRLDELYIVYQPKFDLDLARVTGVEALLRWNSAEFGQIPPTVFIPLAEEVGLIDVFGEFVLTRTCQDLRRWQKMGLSKLTAAVNVSAMQLGRGNLAKRLYDILAEQGVAPDQVEIELTESMLMANPERSLTILNEIKAVGVTLAIDDFGTGYSSLAYLQRLPIDTLKIDQTFVSRVTFNPDDETILAAIIYIAHSLGMNVVAEGVETAEQLDYLREKDCDSIQGYLIGKPMTADLLPTFLRQPIDLKAGPA